MDEVKHFGKLIRDIKFAMLTTVNAESGSFRSRPMTLQEAEFDGDLWFFASRSSHLAKDIGRESKVNLTFADVKSNCYISATGLAEVLTDLPKAKELWNPAYKAWFSKGLEDPDLCLVKVSVETADYWESPSSPIVHMFGFAKAMLTGKRAGGELGQHGHINLV